MQLQAFCINMKVLLKMTVTESVPESVFGKVLSLTMSGNEGVYDRFCGAALSSFSLFSVKLPTFTINDTEVDLCRSLL